MRTIRLGALALVAALAACATLQQIVQPLNFSAAPGQQAELRLLGPSLQRPLGGVGVRLWARVQNPNPLGVNLTHIAGTLFLADSQAGSVDLPLGVALQANGETTFPVDVSISFSDIPGLAGTLTRALSGSALPYRLDGRFSVGAGALGSFEFGPTTLLTGNATVLR
ncbi:MAG TPA: LEA type 2 family protein [Longimicrobiales bacterium]